MKRLYLSKKERMVAGICGGISEMYDIDPSLIRLAVIFICIVSGVFPLATVYLIGWMIIPDASEAEVEKQ